MRCLVTGATGFIGQHLVAALLTEGHEVRALTRRPSDAGRFSPSVDVRVGDMRDPETLTDLPEGMDTVFHLASIMRGSHADFRAADVEGTRHLVAACRRHGVARLVFASTMAVYALGDLHDGSLLSDTTPLDDPDNLAPYARAKLEIEMMLRAAREAAGPEFVVLRPALVYGPGSSPFLEHLPHLGALKGNRYVVFGDGDVPLPLTYVHNVVDALLLAAEHSEADGQAYFIVDDQAMTQREFARSIGALTGRPLSVVAIPGAMGWGIGLAAELASRIRGKAPPTTRRLIRGKSRKLRYAATAAKRELGWQPRVALEEGLQTTVQGWVDTQADETIVGSTEAES